MGRRAGGQESTLERKWQSQGPVGKAKALGVMRNFNRGRGGRGRWTRL